MNKESLRIEAMSEILEEVGVEATPEQVKRIVSDFSGALEVEGESFGDYVSFKQESSQECIDLKNKIKLLEADLEIYRNSVRKRTGARNVYIAGEQVKYDL